MADLRRKVEEERGLLKKLELAIPGFRGYRKREDLRIADSLLRTQLADRLKNIGIQVERCRHDLVKRIEFDLLEDVARLVNQIQTTENRVRHADQGYTGISADYRIEEGELNRLYEWDIGLIDNIDRVKGEVASLQTVIASGDNAQIGSELRTVDATLRDFNSMFDRRVETIAGLEV